jgi:hypothetical protein
MRRIVPLTLREANDFVEAHHRHSARTSNDGGKFAIGLEWDGELVGVAIVGRPVARLLQRPGTAELLRCCVKVGAPTGAGKTLNSRCKRIWQLMGGTRLVTYTLASETAGSITGAGFVWEAKVKGRKWNGDKNGDRAIAEEDKNRWGAQLAEPKLDGVRLHSQVKRGGISLNSQDAPVVPCLARSRTSS